MKKMTFSFVICTHNGGERLWDVVNAIKNGNTLPYELVIVNNNSSSLTVGVIMEISEKIKSLNIRIVNELMPGLSYARNAGVNAANGEYICFIDDDAIVTSDFLEKINKVADLYKPDYFGGSTRIDYESKLPRWFIEDDLHHLYALGRLYNSSRWLGKTNPCLWGVGLCVRKDAYIKIMNRFGELKLTGRKSGQMLAGDDSEICYQLALIGCKGYYDPEIVLTHMVNHDRFTKRKILRTMHGFGIAYPILSYYKMKLGGVGKFTTLLQQSSFLWSMYCKFKIFSTFHSNKKNFEKMRIIRFYQGVYLGIDLLDYEKVSIKNSLIRNK